MEIVNSILSSDILTFVVLGILGYVIFWVYTHRFILLAACLLVVLAYGAYLYYSKDKVSTELGKVSTELDQTRSEVARMREEEDGFRRTSMGYAQNNPGNIRNASVKFFGEVPSKSEFKQFSSMKCGFCAMSTLLYRYIRGGHNTINKIVHRYAPASDGNDPRGYAANVSKHANVKPDHVLTDADFRNGNVLNIIYFMTKVEQGYAPNIKDVYEGYAMFVQKEIR